MGMDRWGRIFGDRKNKKKEKNEEKWRFLETGGEIIGLRSSIQGRAVSSDLHNMFVLDIRREEKNSSRVEKQ